MELIIAAVALFVAAWQLHLQRLEIRKGNDIEQLSNDLETLKMAADMVKTEIDLREKIISSKKSQKTVNWDVEVQPHIDIVNNKLRPSLRSIQMKIINMCGGISELKELPKYFIDPKRDSNGAKAV